MRIQPFLRFQVICARIDYVICQIVPRHLRHTSDSTSDSIERLITFFLPTHVIRSHFPIIRQSRTLVHITCRSRSTRRYVTWSSSSVYHSQDTSYRPPMV